MLPHSNGRAGAFPLWTVIALLLVTLSVMMMRPVPAESTTLEDGLGADVVVRPLSG
ncbi:MAG: hypothetical protein AAF762_06965 [Pseudomonadota bacterium]